MGETVPSDTPKVSYGMLSHPPLAWTAIEGTARGTYSFTSTDAFVKRAPKNSKGVALVDLAFGWTPGWAVANQSSCSTNNRQVVCTAPPDNLQDWANFVTAVVDHYNGKTAPHVAYYEIWNEANTTQFFTGTPAQLAEMSQIAYPILKTDPYSQVLTPSVVWLGNAEAGTTWTAAYLAAGGLADGVTFHGYPSKTGTHLKAAIPLPESPLSTNAPIQTMIPAFRAMANANGMSGKPLLTTEGGWGVDGVTDPDMQTAWITHYEVLQAGLAASNNLIAQTWYEWGKGFSGTIEASTGLPTPAGYAYNVVYGWLLGEQPQPCTSAGNIWSCAVGSNRVVWDTSQKCSAGVCTTSTYTPPPGYSQYVDVTNTVHDISGTIALGVKPILLEP